MKLKAHALSPQKYNPSTKFVTDSRFANIGVGMGLGNKCWEKIISPNRNPGVGNYNIPSIFDKRRKNKVPLN
jgi:hypothetical protein